MGVEFHTSLATLSVLEGVPLGVADPIAYIRASNPMPLHAEEIIEQAITEVALDDLVLVDDLTSRGLETNLPDWMAHLNLKWQKRSRVGNPIFSMLPDVNVRREDSKLDLALDSLPVYCVSSEFTIHPRLFAEWQYAVQRGLSNATLDVSMAQDHIRRINEAIDLATLEGPPIQPEGVHIDGLLDTPNVVEFETHTKWTASGKTGQKIYGDVATAIDTMQTQHHNGKLVMYVSKRYNRILNGDYVTTQANTISIRDRILQDTDIEDIVKIPTLDEDTVIFVEPKKTNLDIVVGQRPTIFSWMEGPAGLQIRRFIALACILFRIREDYDGQNGIVKMVATK